MIASVAASLPGLSQAAIDHAAVIRAAEERRRQAEEAARALAEEARKRAEEARKLAEEARKKADDARKLAEAAEAKKAQTQAEQEAATKLRAQAKTVELDALKKEATANLRTKEETLANSKLDDVRQRRAPSDPSEATRAAQAEVDAAQKTQALYKPVAGMQGADQPAPSDAGTQALLEKAQKAAKPVFDAQARGSDGTKEQKAALNVAVTEWLEAAQQDMRTASLKAQAEGGDPNAAIDQEATTINQAIDKGGVFDPKAMGAYVDKAQAGVKAETPEIRQLRREQYNVNQSGKKQIADARTEATDVDAAADKAEAYAERFGDGPGGNDTIITAKQNAKDEAARLRGLANRADAKLDGLVKAFGASDPADPVNENTPVVGAVNADYNARVADLEVKDLSAKYDQALAGGDVGKIAEADSALREAQDGQRYMRALADDEAARLDRSDAEIEYTDAEGAWNAEAQKRPGTYTVTEHNGDKKTTKTIQAEGYDAAFWAKPGSAEGKKVQSTDGKYYDVDGDKKTELDPVTARLWAAHEKREAATQRMGDTGSALAKVKEDLIGGTDGSGPKLDAARYLDNADAINQRLADANADVAAAQSGLGPKRPPGFIGPVTTRTTPEQLGVALEKQRTAQAEADALKAMQDLRGAERDQAAGKPVDDGKLEGLREAAREKQRRHEESRPKLSAADEKKMRDEQLPKARSDEQTKAGEVDKLTAPGSTATEAERNKALDELDALKLAVRDYETQLELIDAERDWYAAQNQYSQTAFAKPQLSMFMKNGESVTGDVYPQRYDPTWNLKPGKDGKVSAEGLPRGLSPDDIEVRLDPCGGGYTVIVKKDSEVVGWQKSERYGDMRNFVVREGEYKMNPTTARLWETSEFGNGRLAQARTERGQVEQRLGEARAEAPPAPGEEPLIGPDGKPVPTLRLGDDLTQRKKTVDQSVGTATTERDKAQAAYDAGTGDRTALKNALDDANSSLAIAKSEQTAVDAVLLWQEAHRTRQLYDANERAGRAQPMCYAKPPSEMESDARANAQAARSQWLGSRNKFYTDTATRDLGAAQAAHDRWKRDNPTLAETGSDTWKALQAAQGKVDVAKRYQVAGATDNASAREQSFIAQNLRPDQHGDGAELYKLFMKDPKVMAQSIINSHYVQYGGQFTQMQNRTQLANQVAIALGWTPDIELDPATPANNERLQQTQNLFPKLGKEHKEILDKTVDKLVELGGDKARVMVLPVVYGIEGEQGGIVKTALFKVETKPGVAKYVDEQGWEYDSLDDYRANNNLPVEGVNLVTPEDGNFTLDADGNVKLFSGDARTETGWETFRRRSHLDVVAGVVGLVAGVALTVGSLGTLSAPGVMLIAGSAAALAAGYGVATSTESLVRQGSHGQDINPFTSTQARLDWLNLGLSAVSVPVVGASTRATMQAMRARNALTAAAAAREAGDATAAAGHLDDFARHSQSAATWGRPAAAAAKPLGVGSAYAFGEGVVYLADNWKHMTPAERNKQLGMLALNASGFASPVFARGYLRVHHAVKPPVSSAPTGIVPTGHATKAHEAGVGDSQRAATTADPLQPFREPSVSARSGSDRGGPTGPSTAGGFRGRVAKISGPTKALFAFGATQGGAVTAKLFGAGGFYDNVTGGAWASWVNQTRGLGTRGAYYTGKRGLENALELARAGDAAGAVKQVELVARRAPLRGLSPAEIASRKQKAIDQLSEFGEASARYQQGIKAAGVPDDRVEAFPVRLASEAEIKAGTEQKLPDMADGTLVGAIPKAQVLRHMLRDPNASPEALAQAVDAYRAGEAPALAAFGRLRPETRDRLVAARDAELAYRKVQSMVNEEGNLINMKDVQGALGSTMHMGSRVGITFKYLALGFATNSGLGGSYNFIRQAFTSGAWTSVEGGLRTAGLSGEVVGNVPNIGIQWNYLRALNTRTKFSDAGPDSKVPIAEVKAYLDKRLKRMESLHDKWRWLEKRMPDSVRIKAQESVVKDETALKEANQRGDPAPLENRTYSKHVLLRKKQAAGRVQKMKDAIAEAARTGDDSHLRQMAKSESEKAAKSMNTAGDFMALPSMYRYTFMGVLLASNGHPVLAGLTMFHGIVSNGGWLRAQQGKGTIYNIKMAPTGLYEGNGLFGVGKRLGRGYNQVLDKLPDSAGEKLANLAQKTPVVKRFAKDTDNVFESLKLGASAEDAANRRRVRLLLTGATAPTVNLIVALSSDDDSKKAPSPTAPGGPVPTHPPSCSPPSSGPSTPPGEALSQLFNLDPRFDRRLMDGIATNIEGDPTR